jgi:hypothetical protein
MPGRVIHSPARFRRRRCPAQPECDIRVPQSNEWQGDGRRERAFTLPGRVPLGDDGMSIGRGLSCIQCGCGCLQLVQREPEHVVGGVDAVAGDQALPYFQQYAAQYRPAQSDIGERGFGEIEVVDGMSDLERGAFQRACEVLSKGGKITAMRRRASTILTTCAGVNVRCPFHISTCLLLSRCVSRGN